MPRIRAANIEAHKTLTRTQIIDAVHDLIGALGASSVTIAEVAAEVGIGRTTLYEYFVDRDDLIAAMVEERLPQVIAGIIQDVPDGCDPMERMLRLARETLRFIVNDRVLGRILHHDMPALKPAAQDRVRLAHLDLSREMIATYRTGVEQGVLRQYPSDVVGRFIQDLIMSSARVLNAAPDPVARFDEVAAALDSFLVGGLSHD